MTKLRNDERDRSKSPLTWPSLAAGPSLEAAGPAIAGMAEVNGRFLLNWMALQRASTGFLVQRVHEEVDLTHRLAKCSGPQDMCNVYANFYQQTFADYKREFGELMRLGQTSFSQTTIAAQKTMETARRDTPQAAA